MIGLIDIDILIYHFGTSVSNVDFGESEVIIGDINLGRAKDAIVDKLKFISEDLGLDGWYWSMGNGESFRKTLDPTYKSHRRPPPDAVTQLRWWFRETYPQLELPGSIGHEADDVLGLAQKPDGSTVVVTRDKDLLQVPGWNYNPMSDKLRWITEPEGFSFQLYQTLVGDSADGYKGCCGIGEKRALELLTHAWETLGFDPVKLQQVVHFTFLSQGMTTADFVLQTKMATIFRRKLYPIVDHLPADYTKFLGELNGQTNDGLPDVNPPDEVRLVES